MSEENTLLECNKDEKEKVFQKDKESVTTVVIKEEQPIIEPKKKKPRLYWADCLRIYSMFNIILLHCAGSTFENKLTETKNRNVIFVCTYNCITRFAVPVFIMLSGMFFLNPNKKFSLSRLVKKNILRLLTAFYFWSALNAFFNVMKPKTRPPIFSSEFNKRFLILFFPGEGYLWFILMIIGCYLCIPVLRHICNDKKTMKYFLGLWIVWGSIIPTIRDVLNLVDPEVLGKVFSDWVNNWHFNFAIEYIGYFVGGYYVFKFVNIEKLKYRIIVYSLGLLDLITVITVCCYIEIKTASNFSYIRGNLSITNMFYSFVVFLFFKYEIGRIQFSEKSTKIITKLSALTFGMYLAHMFVKNILSYVKFTEDHIGNNIHYTPAIGVPILFIVISSICLLISYAISFIPILNNYII